MPTKTQLQKAAAKTVATINAIKSDYQTQRIREIETAKKNAALQFLERSCIKLGLVAASFGVFAAAPIEIGPKQTTVQVTTKVDNGGEIIQIGDRGGRFIRKISKNGTTYRKYLV